MALGIDPKNDYAFKCVFGSERHSRVLIHMLNAVLKPSPERRVQSVDIVNPMTEPVILDEKLSILDIRARDQSGRQFNVEMQMAAHPGLRGQFLYYWARLYGGQLQSGEEYETLEPVISICFLDGLLFPETDRFHLPFRIWEPQTRLTFTDHLAIHLFQLPNFTKGSKQLSDPLDLWLYFLNNGESLDPDNLPEPLRISEVEEAMSVLKGLTQEEIERERYEARERARRDALSWRKALERREAEVDKAQAEAAQALAKGLAKGRDEGRTEGLIGQVRLCERFLKRTPLSDEQLNSMSVDDLKQLLEELESQLPT